MNLALHELLLFGSGLTGDEVGNVEKLLRFLKHVQIDSPLANLTPGRLQGRVVFGGLFTCLS